MNKKQKSQAAPTPMTGTASTGQGQTTAGVGMWSIDGTDELALAIKRGRASLLGEARAKWKKYGCMDGAEARREKARTLYGEYLAKYPHASRANLCGMVAETFDVIPSTVAEWVPNPTPTCRGRPKKK